MAGQCVMLETDAGKIEMDACRSCAGIGPHFFSILRPQVRLMKRSLVVS